MLATKFVFFLFYVCQGSLHSQHPLAYSVFVAFYFYPFCSMVLYILLCYLYTEKVKIMCFETALFAAQKVAVCFSFQAFFIV